MSEKKVWVVQCKYDTHTPTMSFPKMYAGPNEITKPADARRILSRRGMVTYNAQECVDVGLLSFEVVKSLGHDVVDPGAVEIVKEEVVPEGVAVVEDLHPKFSRMTRDEMREKAEVLSGLGIDAGLRARDNHDDMTVKMDTAWALALEEGLIQ